MCFFQLAESLLGSISVLLPISLKVWSVSVTASLDVTISLNKQTDEHL